MRKLFLGLSLATTALSYAQNTTPVSSASSIRYGAKLGINISKLSKISGMDSDQAKVGLNAGIFATIPVSEKFSVQPELMYSNLGAKYSESIQPGTGGITNIYTSYTKSLSYITVPVMFQYNFTPGFYVEAGPEIGLLAGGKDKMKVETTTASGTSKVDRSEKIEREDYNTFNFGIGLGAGYYFYKNLGVTARYVAGVTDLVKDRPSGSNAVRNNVFQIGLAYKF